MSGAAIAFTFDGRVLTAKPGQTLAAALLDNGLKLVGRSFKYHRPRGILSAGIEEPNALVTVGAGGRMEPNTRATDLFVYEGMVATSQNSWPSLSYDAGAALQLVAKALPAGFYYKTFFGPPKLWLFYEQFIRRAAGLGPAPTVADPDRYAQRAAFCDVLVVGGGPAGLIAARDAARAGKRVILVEQDAELAPSLLRDPQEIEGKPGRIWADEIAAEISSSGSRVLTRTSASGLWDDNFICLSEKLVEPGQAPVNGFAQRYWHVRADEVVLATGAIERPLTFANNDLPGVMLSQAVRTYVNRFGVVPGRKVIVATTNDDGYRTAQALREAGADVKVLDSRAAPAGQDSGFAVFNAASPVSARGGKRGVRGLVAVVDGAERTFACDLIAMAGGFTPVVHLHMQAGGKLAWDESAQAFTPGHIAQNVRTVGLAAQPQPTETLGAAGNAKHAFVDFQNDVTVADLDLAWREGYRSVEHLKRYTTLGMATDQGKTSNMAALDRIARREGMTIPEAGLTTFRPPYTPVSMGALAGASVGGYALPTRRPALHALHAAKNPIWFDAGYWKRPRCYPRDGETLAQSGLREARAVRQAAGLCDVSTLAKFEVQGPDAVRFLERVCATTVGKLAVGRGRYTFMLREDGLVFDDGTVWRLEEDRYLLTSSTGGASRMHTWLSYVRQHLCADLKVSVVCVQEHYAAIAVAGPKTPGIIAALTGAEAPRHMSVIETAIAGAPVLLMAASFSGERAFEVHFDAAHAAAVWQAIEAKVLAIGGAPYGIEAMELLRIEKGHLVVGPDIDGRLTAAELGLDRMLNKAGGYIGEACLQRPDFADQSRKQLVGVEAIDGGAIPEGSMLVRFIGGEAEGHVTGSGLRVIEGGSIALAHLKSGQARHGEELYAWSPTRKAKARVRVTSPHFYDPAGERYRD
jgi:glycine cleavage system aminomethyltransferase T/NADPH-dependent 2,4-dienoyl-CoA reductase/sulfur reductase-like enzyme